MPLTERGLRQAAAAGTALAASLPSTTTIITSDLRRARQTADAIVAATGWPIVDDQRLRERSVGVFDGLTFAEAEARDPAMFGQIRHRGPAMIPPGGEHAEDVFIRVGKAIDDAVANHRGGTVVLVSHGIALFHGLGHVTGLGSPSKHHTMFALVDNASISIVEHHDSGRADGDADHRATPPWRLRAWNRIDHLAAID